MSQANQNVTPIRTSINGKNKPSRQHTRATKALKRQGMAAVGVGIVAATLTALSLNHLASGIELVTGQPGWQAWAMAVGVDVGFIALELAQIMASHERVRRQVGKFARPAIAGTLMGSAVLNAFAFANVATGWMVYAAAALGVAVPALIYAATRVGTALYIDCHTRG